jgi:hypothetical protein
VSVILHRLLSHMGRTIALPDDDVRNIDKWCSEKECAGSYGNKPFAICANHHVCLRLTDCTMTKWFLSRLSFPSADVKEYVHSILFFAVTVLRMVDSMFFASDLKQQPRTLAEVW